MHLLKSHFYYIFYFIPITDNILIVKLFVDICVDICKKMLMDF